MLSTRGHAGGGRRVFSSDVTRGGVVISVCCLNGTTGWRTAKRCCSSRRTTMPCRVRRRKIRTNRTIRSETCATASRPPCTGVGLRGIPPCSSSASWWTARPGWTRWSAPTRRSWTRICARWSPSECWSPFWCSSAPCALLPFYACCRRRPCCSCLGL